MDLHRKRTLPTSTHQMPKYRLKLCTYLDIEVSKVLEGRMNSMMIDIIIYSLYHRLLIQVPST